VGWKILEWDYQHGEVEMYNGQGEYLGSFDPNTGQMNKPAVRGRECRM